MRVQKTICFTVIVLVICFFVSISQASGIVQDKDPAVEEHSGITLSHDLKVILNQEMNGIEAGMMQIIADLSSGNWESIVKIGKKLKDSFILKQKLTQKQLEELHRSLPSGFIEIDQSFHVTAGKLAHAALQRDGELVNFYFYKLNSKCLQCHSTYAAERFPGLNSTQQGTGDRH